MDRDIAPELMQFGRVLPHIFQAIYEADPANGPVRVSKIDVMDDYHRGTLRPYQLGEFAYVVSLATGKDCIII